MRCRRSRTQYQEDAETDLDQRSNGVCSKLHTTRCGERKESPWMPVFASATIPKTIAATPTTSETSCAGLQCRAGFVSTTSSARSASVDLRLHMSDLLDRVLFAYPPAPWVEPVFLWRPMHPWTTHVGDHRRYRHGSTRKADKGKAVKEAAGDLTDNDSLKNEGRATGPAAQPRCRRRIDKVEETVDR
jgi:uncharacterized protein YjbJ (UPF0337 family)